ncbi:hypothetical protein PC41400_02385 [Paenibacillus chitinolyticus]|uniref:Uncharacterized protein n=1 Tax=Paenibacillus chitinolyticus TaxID=79263 RepID=A0A410WQJ7_9BACL|nr:hypothetical protein PC41400_02385 [Paenibacillus chitinolyticus]
MNTLLIVFLPNIDLADLDVFPTFHKPRPLYHMSVYISSPKSTLSYDKNPLLYEQSALFFFIKKEPFAGSRIH